jgi:hypothetical protein
MERYNLTKLNGVGDKEKYRFADLDTDVETNSAWETFRGNIKM